MINFEKIKPFIKEGKENGISRGRLAEIFQISEREVTASITEARKNHIIILSGNYGYFFPKNDDEIEEFYNRYHAMSVSCLCALKDARAELKKKGRLQKKKEQ